MKTLVLPFGYPGYPQKELAEKLDNSVSYLKSIGIDAEATSHNANYFLLWTKPDANYICLEPWNGVQDIVGSCYDISKKEGIIKLERNGSYTAVHNIECIKAIDG